MPVIIFHILFSGFSHSFPHFVIKITPLNYSNIKKSPSNINNKIERDIFATQNFFNALRKYESISLRVYKICFPGHIITCCAKFKVGHAYKYQDFVFTPSYYLHSWRLAKWVCSVACISRTWFVSAGIRFGYFPINDMQTPPSLRNGHIYMKHAQCAETDEI